MKSKKGDECLLLCKKVKGEKEKLFYLLRKEEKKWDK